jgi:hypothetical protein
MEKQESDNNQRLIIRGEVKFIDRGNIDKSGRNPKYQIQINLAPTSIEGRKLSSDSNSLLIFLIREKEILEQIDKLPEMLNVVTKLYIFKYSSIIKGKNVNIS